MLVGVYGGSIRPGGGLTVLKQIVESLAFIDNCSVVVYTGEQDSSDGMSETIKALPNVEEVRFFPAVKSGIRYFLSKFFFINEAKKRQFDLLISINYFIQAPCTTMVYHLNLLSFMVGEKDSVGMKLKRLDARLACRRADINIFESNYLYDQACCQTKVNNAHVLYVSIAPEFQCREEIDELPCGSGDNLIEVNIAVVSSPSPHKDNSTCLHALKHLISKRKEVNWRMVFVGGISVDGWSGVRGEAAALGIEKEVSFHGPMNKSDLSNLLNTSLCLMNASLVESFCMVAVEAMSSCCPVIVTDATSMPESVGGAAIIVPQRDAEAFSFAVEKFYDDYDLRASYIEKGADWANKFSQGKFRESFNNISVLFR